MSTNTNNAEAVIATAAPKAVFEKIDGDILFPGCGLGGVMIPRRVERSALVPTASKHYRPDPALLRQILAWWWMPRRGMSFALFGETGTGKSEFWAYFCDKLNWPMVVIQVSESLRPETVKGGMAMKNGETCFELSAAALAAEQGAFLLLDEMDKGSTDFLAALHPLMEGKPLPIEREGRTIKPHAMFRLGATAQTNGCGDMTGRYQSTSKLDEAVRRRFMWAGVDYVAPEVELEILKDIQPAIPAPLLRKVTRFAHQARLGLKPDSAAAQAAVKAGDRVDQVFSALSTRVLVEWANMMVAMGPATTPADAFELVFLSSCEDQDREVFSTLAKAAVGDAWDKAWKPVTA